MPTIRSEYSFEQFEETLQKLAHRIAIDAVTSLNQGDVRIVIYGNKLSRVAVGGLEIKFFAKHASYWHQPGSKYEDWWGFDVEEKLYLTSSHCSKISFTAGSDDSKTATKAKKIEAFISQLMAGVKPVSRFTLAEHAVRTQKTS